MITDAFDRALTHGISNIKIFRQPCQSYLQNKRRNVKQEKADLFEFIYVI